MSQETENSSTTEGSPLILSIAGGKGGVGKSFACSNIAASFALEGLKVIAIDLDFGAANLHTLFGIRKPPRSLIDYLNTSRSRLEDYLISTDLPLLKLASCTGFNTENLTLKHFQKLKLIKHIQKLPCDLVILDLGAGSSKHVVDFFSMTHAGIVVTTPEPTAMMNAYEFMKNVAFRILFNFLKKEKNLSKQLKELAYNFEKGSSNLSFENLVKKITTNLPGIEENFWDFLDELNYFILINQGRTSSDVHLGNKFQGILKKHLRLKTSYLSCLPFSTSVQQSIMKMRPISLTDKGGTIAKNFSRCVNIVGKSLCEKASPGDKNIDIEQKQTESAILQSQYDLDEIKLQQLKEEANKSLMS
ncbi:MAG: P-loop NTPase [Chlamydiales bacterium]|nr:P-loop NTPase [Chlamydiales bacterium]NCF70176.1 P-loop NTPase [Chlamydiales bacterium]